MKLARIFCELASLPGLLLAVIGKVADPDTRTQPLSRSMWRRLPSNP